MTRAATDAATMIKPMIVACTMSIRGICNEEGSLGREGSRGSPVPLGRIPKPQPGPIRAYRGIRNRDVKVAQEGGPSRTRLKINPARRGVRAGAARVGVMIGGLGATPTEKTCYIIGLHVVLNTKKHS